MGPYSLSNNELLQLIVGEESVAYNISSRCDGKLKSLAMLNTSDLCSIPGVTKLKAGKIIASLELARRKEAESHDYITIRNSEDIATVVRQWISDEQKEHFVCLYLSRANRIISKAVICIGSQTGTVVDVPDLVRRALYSRACNIVVAHNHPSGSLRPSSADEKISQQIKQACSYFDMRLLDSIIVTQSGYFSFADNGLL